MSLQNIETKLHDDMNQFFQALPLAQKELLFSHLSPEQKSTLQKINNRFFKDYVSNLPDDALNNVLKFLPERDLFICRGVCQRFFDNPVVFTAIEHYASAAVLGFMHQKGRKFDDSKLTTKVKEAVRVLDLCPQTKFFEGDIHDNEHKNFIFRLQHPSHFPNIHAISLVYNKNECDKLIFHLRQFCSLRTLYLLQSEEKEPSFIDHFVDELYPSIEKLLIPNFKISAHKIAHLKNLKVLMYYSMNLYKKPDANFDKGKNSFHKLPNSLIHIIETNKNEDSDLWYGKIDPKTFHLTKLKTLKLGCPKSDYSLKDWGWTDSMIQTTDNIDRSFLDPWHKDCEEEKPDVYSDVVDDHAIIYSQKTQLLSGSISNNGSARSQALVNYLKMKRSITDEKNKKLTTLKISHINLKESTLIEELYKHKATLEHLELIDCSCMHSRTFFDNCFPKMNSLKTIVIDRLLYSMNNSNDIIYLKINRCVTKIVINCSIMHLDLQEATSLEELECPHRIATRHILPPSLKRLKITVADPGVSIPDVSDSNIEELEVEMDLDLSSDSSESDSDE